MKSYKALIFIIFFSTLFAFIFTGILYVAYKMMNGGGTARTFTDAFAGAFFAFLFTRIAMLFDELYKKEQEGYRTLISLQHLLNEHLTIINGNIHSLKDIDKTLEKVIKENMALMNPHKFQYAKIDFKILSEIRNIDMVNDLAQYLAQFMIINDDLKVSESFYVSVVDRCFGVNDPEKFEFYKANIQSVYDGHKQIEPFLLDLKNNNIEIHVKLKVLLASKPLSVRIFGFLSTNRYPRNIVAKVSDEKNRVLSQLKSDEDVSRKKIEELIGRK